MRLPVYDKPRIIGCARDYSHHIALPRGCMDEVAKLFKELKIKYTIQEELIDGQTLDCSFYGELREEQKLAVEAMIKADIGVLSATTAFGKTVIAAWLIAKRQVSTLIIVHTKQLQDQWVERLQTFLARPKNKIGRLGGGRKKITGCLDVILIQSLTKYNDIPALVSQYGQVIVDECHHIPSNSFDDVIRQIKSRFIVGLSATLVRKDGRHPIITMRCGPVLYRVDAKAQAAVRPFEHYVFVRPTNFRPCSQIHEDLRIQFQDLYSELISHTERNEHLDLLYQLLADKVQHLIILRGGMGAKEMKGSIASVA